MNTEQIDAAAKAIAQCMDYPWEHMPEQGRAAMRKHAQTVLSAGLAQAKISPVEPNALTMSITELDAWADRADGELLTPSEGESVLLVLHELKRLRALTHALPIDFKQATELLAMFGGEPGEVTLLTGEGHSGRGLYAHYSEYPEEGAEFLGVADDEAVPGKQATDQGGWQLVPKKPTEAMLDAAVQRICYGPEGGFTRISGPQNTWAAMLAAAPTLLGVADGDAVGGKSGGA